MVEIRIHPERLLTPIGEKVLDGCVSDAVLVTVRRWCAGGVDGWTQLDTCQVGSRCRRSHSACWCLAVVIIGCRYAVIK
jgi:hypothetical protein